jgi:hypothetical protein
VQIQPSQGDVRRLHRLPYHPYQLAIQRIKVSLLTQVHGEAGEEGEPTSGLEPLTCSLRVITQPLQGCAGGCKYPLSKGFPLLRLAESCTVLRSQWCQSGIKPFEKQWSGVEIARPHALGSHSYCKIYLKR